MSTLGREVRLNGRNVARVNGRSVNAGLLRELGEYLVDVHGQSEHLSLLRVSQHLGMLDRYASSLPGSQLAPRRWKLIAQTYQRLQKRARELEEIRQAERDAARRIDMLTFQIKEIEAARLHPGEDRDCARSATAWQTPKGCHSWRSRPCWPWTKARPKPRPPPTCSARQREPSGRTGPPRPIPADLARHRPDALRKPERPGAQPAHLPGRHRVQPAPAGPGGGAPGLIQNLKRKYGDTIRRSPGIRRKRPPPARANHPCRRATGRAGSRTQRAAQPAGRTRRQVLGQ